MRFWKQYVYIRLHGWTYSGYTDHILVVFRNVPAEEISSPEKEHFQLTVQLIICLQRLRKEKSLILAIPQGHVELGGMDNPEANVDLV